MKFHHLVTYALTMFLLGFASTSLQFFLLSPVANSSYFTPDIFPFPMFIILLNIPRFRRWLHIIHTVSKSIFHKYIVQLTSVSISWCSPGIEFSLRLLKPYASDNKTIYFAVSERLPLWHLLPSTCGPNIFRYDLSQTTFFQPPHYNSFVSPLPFSVRISLIMPYSSFTLSFS